MNTIDNRVKETIAEQLRVDLSRITDDATIFDDLGGDDLDRLELTISLETEFCVELSDEDADAVRTVGDVVNLIKRKMGNIQ